MMKRANSSGKHKAAVMRRMKRVLKQVSRIKTLKMIVMMRILMSRILVSSLLRRMTQCGLCKMKGRKLMSRKYKLARDWL